MGSLYEHYNCKDEEELYYKVKKNVAEVKSLKDFMDFAKLSILNKNNTISSPQDLFKYINSIQLPDINEGKIIFVNIKNQPVYLKTITLENTNNYKNLLKDGLLAGGITGFIVYNESFSLKKISEIQNLFETVGIKILDSVTFNNINNTLFSNEGKESYKIIDSINPINLETSINKNGFNNKLSTKKEYLDFVRYFAKKEIKGLNIIKDNSNIMEKLKIGYQHQPQEFFGVIYYDKQKNIIQIDELSRGGVNQAIVDTKILAREIVQLDNLHGIALFHCHPSGIANESKEDIQITKKIANICKFLDVELLDHYIISKSRILSFVKEIDNFKSDNIKYSEYINKKEDLIIKSLIEDCPALKHLSKEGIKNIKKLYNDNPTLKTKYKELKNFIKNNNLEELRNEIITCKIKEQKIITQNKELEVGMKM